MRIVVDDLHNQFDRLVVAALELRVISVAMVGDIMCLYDGTQWCSVCGEEEGSNNWTLRNI